MKKYLLSIFCSIFLLADCVTPSHNEAGKPVDPPPSKQIAVEKTIVLPSDSLVIDTSASHKPASLTDLPVSQNGDIILSEGFYESEFKSYCLQPGSPSPSDRDAYLQGPLSGHRKDIVETILRNSLNKPYLDQKNIQLLLWSVVSGSNYSKLSRNVKSTAEELLTPKQIFQLKGGYIGVVRNVSSYIPVSDVRNIYSQMNSLFEMGNSSYEDYERIAVPQNASVVHHPEYKKDQWYKQYDGYYVRYFPSNYKKVKVQVYVPKGSLDSTGLKKGNHLLFDPINMMAIPANSNAQQLGIGAPVLFIVRKVIQIENQTPREMPKRPESQQTQAANKPIKGT